MVSDRTCLRCQTETTTGSSHPSPRDPPDPIAPVLTQISSLQLHLEHLTASSALVQGYNSQGDLSAPDSKQAVQAVALGGEDNISKASLAFLGSA